MITELPDDEWNEHVMAGEAYSAESLVIAVGGMIPLGQLYNPAGSGVRIRLRCIEPMAFLASPINNNISRHDVALPNLNAPTFGPAMNLLSSGSPGVAEFRFDNVPVLVGSPWWLILAAGNIRKDYPAMHLEWGHDLLPGQGVMLTAGVGLFLIMGWQWVEVPE